MHVLKINSYSIVISYTSQCLKIYDNICIIYLIFNKFIFFNAMSNRVILEGTFQINKFLKNITNVPNII